MKNEERALEFLKDTKGTVFILTHEDTDGATSAALMIKYLMSKGIKADFVTGQYDVWRVEEFLAKDYDYYIFLDFCLEELYKSLKSRFKGKKVLIIDHHPSKEIKSVVHVNPRFDDPKIYVSASMVTEGILRKLGFKQEWLGRLGGVGDMAIEGNDQELEAAHLIDSYKAVRGENGIMAIIKLLIKYDDIDRFACDNTLGKFKQLMEREVEKQIHLFELKCGSEINFFEVRSRLRLTSILINEVSKLYPKRTLFFYRKDGNMYKVSARSHKYNLNKLMADAAEGNGSGGGHSQAAGSHIYDIEKFRERVMILTKMKKYLSKQT